LLEDIYSSYCGKLNVAFNPYYANNATIYMNDGNTGKLLRKWTLFKVFPIEYVDEHRDEWNTISFRATQVSVKDLTEEKKMNDETELSIILKKAQPYIELISKLDDVEEHIDKHDVHSSFESVGKEFAESLNRYNSILKDLCVGIMKELYK
jgi:hypothetical protein